jgi:hypothetical protein
MRNDRHSQRARRSAARRYAPVLVAFIFAAPAALAAESWLQCDGTIVTSGSVDGKANTENKSARDIYAFNDDTKRLFKYSDTRKTLDTVFVNDYGPKQIKWSSPAGSSYGDARWEGELDRDKLALKVVRHEKGETMTWAETCKPMQPMTGQSPPSPSPPSPK